MEITRTAGRHLGILEFRVRQAIRSRLVNDRGEGVISMAIAILVIAALGVAMYAIFQRIGTTAGTKAEEQINNIGG
jgi:hypothetical protein